MKQAALKLAGAGICALVLFVAGCSQESNPVTYQESPDITISGTTNGYGVSMLADAPAFYEPFTTSTFTALYYNNLSWVVSIASMTGGCLASMDNLEWNATCPGDTGNGFMSFTVPANTAGGAEMKQVTARTGLSHFGLYEARMKLTKVPGVVQAFFWQGAEAGTDGMEEIDIEFLPIEFGSTGKMRCTIHPKPDDQGHLDPLHQQIVDLDFVPGDAFHVYAFHWTSDTLKYYVDYEQVCRFVRSEGAVIPQNPGLIWINTWTSQNPNFGGGPPTEDATQIMDWVKYWPDEETGIASE